MKFVIFHGAFGSSDGNWFPELKVRLEELGQEVLVPQFPVDKWNDITTMNETKYISKQSLSAWHEVFKAQVLPFIGKNEKVIFVGHSLGAVYILHAVEEFKLQLDSAIFVSAFLDKLGKDWQIDKVNESFYKTDFDFEDLKKRIPTSYVLYSDNDPYVDKQHAQLFSRALESSIIFVKRAGHMNMEVNVNELPLVFELCSTRLDLSLYQRYLKHRARYDAVKKTSSGEIKSIKFPFEEVVDEGIFHFRNIKKRGFATFLTSYDIWDKEEKYFEDARLAAKRIDDFKRVFVVESPNDFKREKLRNLIAKDIEAGIKVYLCPIESIRFDVPYLDFGIWDDEYVCIVTYGKDHNFEGEVELNSQSEILEKSKGWEQLILSKSTAITSASEDIDKFIASNYGKSEGID